MVFFRHILFCAILNLILVTQAIATEEFDDVLPNSSIGQGRTSLRVKILDPVSQMPWANKPYRFSIYDTNGQVTTVVNGNTDENGFTATVFSQQNISHYSANPRMLAGYFPYTARMRLLQDNQVDGLAHTIYIHFFEDGSVFTGLSDTHGDTAEIGSNRALSVKTKIQYIRPGKIPDICDWSSVANVLNQTIDSSPAKKIDLIKQVIEWESIKNENSTFCESFYEQYSDELINQVMMAAAEGGAELLDVTVPFIVDTKAELLSKNVKLASPKLHLSSAEFHLQAILEILDALVEKPAVSNDFLNLWANQAITLNSQIKQLHNQDIVLNLTEKLVLLKKFSAGEKVLSLLKGDFSQFRESQQARKLAIEALIANQTGNIDKAQNLFEEANNWVVGAKENDILEKFREYFSNVPAGQMRISASMIADAQQWCPQLSEKDNLFTMFPFVGQLDKTMMSRMLTLDALLSYGASSAGEVTLPKNCISTAPESFNLTEHDIEQIQQAKMIGGILLLPEAKMGNFDANRMNLALLAWLQSVKLAPNSYPPNKMTEKINLGF